MRLFLVYYYMMRNSISLGPAPAVARALGQAEVAAQEPRKSQVFIVQLIEFMAGLVTAGMGAALIWTAWGTAWCLLLGGFLIIAGLGSLFITKR